MFMEPGLQCLHFICTLTDAYKSLHLSLRPARPAPGQSEGSGKVRMVVAKQKQKLSKAAQKKVEKFASTRGTSGLASSLAFTPIQARF